MKNSTEKTAQRKRVSRAESGMAVTGANKRNGLSPFEKAMQEWKNGEVVSAKSHKELVEKYAN